MELKEFLEKYGILSEFCREVRRQIDDEELRSSGCYPPNKRDKACIGDLHWFYTIKGRHYWEDFCWKADEVKKYKHTFEYYYNLCPVHLKSFKTI